jgi:deoxyadenosine/deoxycytidine kinase
MLFSIEGNIGSGKSTLIRALKEFEEISDIPVVFVDEPVTQWESIKNKDGKNMIELFYGNQARYAFAFQMMAYISRLNMLQEAIRKHPNAIIITERCLLTDYNIFAKLLYENKSMLQEEYEIYVRWFDSFQNIKIDGTIYVRTDVEVAFERCQQRSRTGETIDKEYLKQCHEKHEEWMSFGNPFIIDNNVTEQEEAVWMIHDYIQDVVWEHKEPISDNCLTHVLCLILFYSFAMILMIINILNFQRNSQFHFDSYQK